MYQIIVTLLLLCDFTAAAGYPPVPPITYNYCPSLYIGGLNKCVCRDGSIVPGIENCGVAPCDHSYGLDCPGGCHKFTTYDSCYDNCKYYGSVCDKLCKQFEQEANMTSVVELICCPYYRLNYYVFSWAFLCYDGTEAARGSNGWYNCGTGICTKGDCACDGGCRRSSDYGTCRYNCVRVIGGIYSKKCEDYCAAVSTSEVPSTDIILLENSDLTSESNTTLTTSSTSAVAKITVSSS